MQNLTLTMSITATLSEQVEKQLLKRDLGIATRFLHQPGVPLRTLHFITDKFNLQSSSVVEGRHVP
jgi:polyphosphate kinase